MAVALAIVLLATTSGTAHAADAPIVGDLEVSNVAISPDGDGRADAAELVFRAQRPAWVRAVVVDDSGLARRTLWAAQVAAGPMLLMWDGLDDTGAALPDARYRVRVEAWAAGDEHAHVVAQPAGDPIATVERTVDIDTSAPSLATVTSPPRHRAHVRLLELPITVDEESLVEIRVYEGKQARNEPLALALPAGRQRATIRTSDVLYRRRTAGTYRIELIASDAAWNVTRRWVTVHTVKDPVVTTPNGNWGAGSDDGTRLPSWLRPVMLRATKGAGVPASWATSPALAQLILHESSFNPRAQNPTSTAYGLFQFLDQTWKGVGCVKTSDPYRQSVCGLRYVKNRYRTPERAWAFWQAQSPHWYGFRGDPRAAVLNAMSQGRIGQLQVSNASISPDGDGRADSVAVLPQLRLASTVSVTVTDAGGVPVRALWSADMPPGETQLEWDGLDDAGQRLPDGTYTIVVRASGGIDLAGDVDEATAAVRIDTTAPQAVPAGARVRAKGAALLRVPLQLEEEASVTVRVRDGAKVRELTFLQPAGSSYVELRAPRAWQSAKRAGKGSLQVVASDAAWNELAVTVPVDIVPGAVPIVPWSGGELLMPSPGPITSGFGPRWGRAHQGIDIGAPTGTPIKAAASGRVSFAGWASGYGNVVYIDHGGGLQTRYGHQSKLRVRTGQTVRRGQRIGDVGSTGNSTGPHLHFEVRRGGVARNPLMYL